MKVVLMMLLGSLGAACDDGPYASEPPSRPVAIVDNSRWAQAKPDADPFPHHRASVAAAGACPKGVAVEGDALEIRTGECHYANLRQELQSDLHPGGVLRLTMFHAALVPLGGATEGDDHGGHAALSIDGVVVWERRFEIPQSAAPYADDIPVTQAFQAGDEVVFHLHNHGANTWKLLSIQSLASDAGAEN